MLEVKVVRRLAGFALDVSFSAGNEIVVLFGPSGSGKSMILRSIAGIVTPDEGRIIAGRRILFDREMGINLPAQQRRVGYVPQRYALFPHLNVEQNIGFALGKLKRDERQRRVKELIGSMGLAGLSRHRPGQLSGGQAQRVALARALASEPDILLLDEPFGALDLPIRTELRDMLLGLKQSVDITIVIVTHDLTDAFLLGQKIVMIEDGRILQTGSREDVFYRPATVRAAELVATRNILQGKVIGQEGSLAVVLWNHQTLKVAVDKHLATNTPVHLCIRPTQIMIRRPETEDGAGQHNVFQGAIVDEVISMETYRLFVSLGPADLRYDLEIDLPGYVYFRLGLDTRKEIEFSIRPEAVHLIPSGN